MGLDRDCGVVAISSFYGYRLVVSRSVRRRRLPYVDEGRAHWDCSRLARGDSCRDVDTSVDCCASSCIGMDVGGSDSWGRFLFGASFRFGSVFVGPQ